MDKKKYVKACGNKYEIESYIKNVNGNMLTVPEGTKGAYPVIRFPMMSDYKWQLSCLEDRLEHPEKYSDTEDLPATIAMLHKWLDEHAPQEVTA
ncbi:MAG: hypothetical protein IJN05_12320 [Ruminococcus sp.]|nr:hypothetical protein [Ruminococcus sp.]